MENAGSPHSPPRGCRPALARPPSSAVQRPGLLLWNMRRGRGDDPARRSHSYRPSTRSLPAVVLGSNEGKPRALCGGALAACSQCDSSPTAFQVNAPVWSALDNSLHLPRRTQRRTRTSMQRAPSRCRHLSPLLLGAMKGGYGSAGLGSSGASRRCCAFATSLALRSRMDA